MQVTNKTIVVNKSVLVVNEYVPRILKNLKAFDDIFLSGVFKVEQIFQCYLCMNDSNGNRKNIHKSRIKKKLNNILNLCF